MFVGTMNYVTRIVGNIHFHHEIAFYYVQDIHKSLS